MRVYPAIATNYSNSYMNSVNYSYIIFLSVVSAHIRTYKTQHTHRKESGITDDSAGAHVSARRHPNDVHQLHIMQILISYPIFTKHILEQESK